MQATKWDKTVRFSASHRDSWVFSFFNAHSSPSGVIQTSVGVVFFSVAQALHGLRRITFDPGAGHLSPVRVFFGRVIFTLSGTKRKTHVFRSPSWGIFDCSFFGHAILIFSDSSSNTSRERGSNAFPSPTSSKHRRAKIKGIRLPRIMSGIYLGIFVIKKRQCRRMLVFLLLFEKIYVSCVIYAK